MSGDLHKFAVSLLFLTSFCKQVNTERAIRHAIQERLPIVVVINKVLSWIFAAENIKLSSCCSLFC